MSIILCVFEFFFIKWWPPWLGDTFSVCGAIWWSVCCEVCLLWSICVDSSQCSRVLPVWQKVWSK